ncbi:hypothetical protein SAY87_014355 [Trapa incisa]|uniref:fructose-bisphosphate aldolase n=1 Tax=Trapa incisa TaxID=236973 RepID=A0AAN7GSI2_9MYRT|nr:hypothetical protein SAY87_014355 [Trapa incisa]
MQSLRPRTELLPCPPEVSVPAAVKSRENYCISWAGDLGHGRVERHLREAAGLESTEANRQAYRTLLVSAPGLGQYISGAILFEETLYQSTVDGKKIVDSLI